MGGEETRAAIDAAAEAFKSWKKKTHAERAGLLERWHDLIRQHEQDLALLLTLEQGKPLAEALAEIRYGAPSSNGSRRRRAASAARRSRHPRPIAAFWC